MWKLLKQKQNFPLKKGFSRSSARLKLCMEESHGINGVDDSYRHLPILYLTFLSIWSLSACSWTVNTFKNRNFQVHYHLYLYVSVLDFKIWRDTEFGLVLIIMCSVLF